MKDWNEEMWHRHWDSCLYRELLRLEGMGGVWDCQRDQDVPTHCIGLQFVDVLEVRREYIIKCNNGSKVRHIAAGKFQMNAAGRKYLDRNKPPEHWLAP